MSLAVNVYNLVNEEISSSSFNVFDIPSVSDTSITKVVRYIESEIFSKNRNGLTRSNITCTGKKVYKQKGTGSARHSDKSAPQFRGGAVAHSNSTSSRALSINKKEKKKVKDYLFLSHLNNINFCWVLINSEIKKTSVVSTFLSKKVPDVRKILFVANEENYVNLSKFSRNIPNCTVKTLKTFSVVDLLNNNFLCIDYSLKNNIEEMYVKN